jgi:syntaxin 8
LFSPTNTKKSVRFSDSNQYQTPPADSDEYSAPELLANQQQIMQDQDESLDRLSDSIGRQRELSIQIGDELDSQTGLLDDLDMMVDRSRSRLDGAKKRLNRFTRKAKENGISTWKWRKLT